MSGFHYISVDWLHNHAEDPVRLHSEIDDEGWESRKVEEFADGKMEFADSDAQSGTTRLGLDRIPSITEIAEDPQFIPVEISKEEFERLWSMARTNA